MLDEIIAFLKDAVQPKTNDFIRISLDKSLGFECHIDSTVIVFGIIIFIVIFFYSRFFNGLKFWKNLEINEAEFGFGDQKIKLHPNITDQQIAYKIWVELSTRKIGLPIDMSNDVIVEVYNSWFDFFAVTRELIKDIPVQKFCRKDTEQIVRLSIEVLNQGLRPHLTKWQARFRRWYENQLDTKKGVDIHPQDIQKLFPEYSELEVDLLQVNQRLINYRKKMYQIVKNS